MGLAFVINEEFVAGKQYFAHDIAVLSEVPSGGFNAEVVKTEEMGIAIVLYDFITDMVKAEDDIPARDDLIWPLVGDNVF